MKASRPPGRFRYRLSHAGILAPDIARGVRASLATLVPFYFARELGREELVWMALGGWLGTLADPGGWRSTRAKTLTIFGLVGAALVALTEFSSSWPLAPALLLTLVAFGGSLVRTLGAKATSLGTLFVVVTAIAAGGGHTDPMRDARWFALGALCAASLSSIVWPVWTHVPLRMRLASVYRELEDYTSAAFAMIERAVPERDPEWAELARTHQRAVRAALEEARAVALVSRARRMGESVLGGNLRTLLGAAETYLPLLIALVEELESMPPAERAGAVGQELSELTRTYRTIADALGAAALGVRKRGGIVPEPPPSAHDVAAAVSLSRRLIGSSRAALQVALALATPSTSQFEHRGLVLEARRALREDLRALRDALSVRSTFFRHALRVAIAVSVAQLVGHVLSPSHVQWVTITTIAVLQPYPGATVKRAFERVVGTILGSVVAVVITVTLRSPLVLAATLVPLSIAAVATRPRSHRLFTFFLTPVFVLLAERWQGDWWIAAARAGDAVVGGAIALVAALVFPSRERKRLHAALESVVAAVRRYAEVVIEAEIEETPSSPDVAAARREVGIALGEAETSLERLLAEPLRAPTEAEDAMLLVTHARRLTSALTALDARCAPAPDEAVLREVLAYVQSMLGGASDLSTAPPDVTVGSSLAVRDALARVVRQAEIVRSVVGAAATKSPRDNPA